MGVYSSPRIFSLSFPRRISLIVGTLAGKCRESPRVLKKGTFEEISQVVAPRSRAAVRCLEYSERINCGLYTSGVRD
jgi:hypothetical protein